MHAILLPLFSVIPFQSGSSVVNCGDVNMEFFYIYLKKNIFHKLAVSMLKWQVK